MITLSEQTLTIIKNFSAFNPQIFIPKGNEIRVLTPAKTTFARAFVEEEFPRDVFLSDVHQFINMLSIHENPQLDFMDKFILVKGVKSYGRYFYGNIANVGNIYETDPQISDEDVRFKISAKQLKTLIQSCSVLRNPHIKIEQDVEGVRVSCINTNNPTSNIYEFKVDDPWVREDQKNSVTLVAEQLKMFNADYEIFVRFNGLVCFKTGKVEYYISGMEVE